MVATVIAVENNHTYCIDIVQLSRATERAMSPTDGLHPPLTAILSTHL